MSFFENIGRSICVNRSNKIYDFEKDYIEKVRSEDRRVFEKELRDEDRQDRFLDTLDKIAHRMK